MRITLLIGSTMFGLCAFSQTSEQLDINNINACINFIDGAFQVSNTSSPGFEAPKGSNLHSIHGQGLWIGGLDVNNQLKLAAQGYAGQGSDFKGACNSNYHRLYKVDKDTIDYHIANYSNTGYVLPDQIANWPAHGDVSCGMPHMLAPFVDINANSIYEPLMGDYPKIKCDQAIWWYMNDDTVHSLSGADPLSIDLMCMAYACNCEHDLALMNTVFIDYDIVYRGIQQLSDVWVGNWVDFDLGCFMDDYVGTDVSRGVMYAYNGDASDDPSCSGASGYGTHPPAMGTMIFGPLAPQDGQDNPGPSWTNNYYVSYATAVANDGVCYKGQGLDYGDGIIDNERLGLRRSMAFTSNITGPQSNPNSATDYYNILRGHWSDGTSLLYGGGGHSSNAGANPNAPCDFIYPSNSDSEAFGTGGTSQFNWTEFNTGPSGGNHAPGDRRMVGASGPFNLQPGQKETITFAYIFGRDYNNPSNTASIEVVLERADSIMQFMEHGIQCDNTVGINDWLTEESSLDLYPNPVLDQLQIVSGENMKGIRIFDAQGRQVMDLALNGKEGRVDLNELSKGWYSVLIETQEGSFQTAQLIKQ